MATTVEIPKSNCHSSSSDDEWFVGVHVLTERTSAANTETHMPFTETTTPIIRIEMVASMKNTHTHTLTITDDNIKNHEKWLQIFKYHIEEATICAVCTDSVRTHALGTVFI